VAARRADERRLLLLCWLGGGDFGRVPLGHLACQDRETEVGWLAWRPEWSRPIGLCAVRERDCGACASASCALGACALHKSGKFASLHGGQSAAQRHKRPAQKCASFQIQIFRLQPEQSGAISSHTNAPHSTPRAVPTN